MYLPPGYHYTLAHDEDGELYPHVASEALSVAKQCNVGILSGKTLAAAVEDDAGNIVAAVWTETDNQDYSFDVVVSPEHQGKGIGRVLVDEYLTIPQDIQDAYPEIQLNLDVINPSLVHMLARRGLAISAHEHGHWLMGDASMVKAPLALPVLAEVPDIETLGVKNINLAEAQCLAEKWAAHHRVVLDNGAQALVALSIDGYDPGVPAGPLMAAQSAHVDFSIKAIGVIKGERVDWYGARHLAWAPKVGEKAMQALTGHLLQQINADPALCQTERVEHDPDKLASALLDNALMLDLERNTSMLATVLQQAESLIYFKGGDRHVSGKMSFATPKQIINAAKSQAFSVHVEMAAGLLRLRFDDDYTYHVVLPPDVPESTLAFCHRVLEQELFDNFAIERERRQRMGFGQYTELDFLPASLQTAAIEKALACAGGIALQQKVFSGITYTPVYAESVVSMAQSDLFNAAYSEALNSMILLCKDRPESIVKVDFPASVSPSQGRMLFDAVYQEINTNHAFVCAHNPRLNAMKERMAAAAQAVFGDNQSLHDRLRSNRVAPAVEPQEDKGNVVSLVRKR